MVSVDLKSIIEDIIQWKEWYREQSRLSWFSIGSNIKLLWTWYSVSGLNCWSFYQLLKYQFFKNDTETRYCYLPNAV